MLTPRLGGVGSAQIGPSPCEKYHCPMFQRCKEEYLACDAFRVYIETDRAMSPYMVMIDGKVVKLSRISPSRKVYEMIDWENDA